MTPKTDTKKKTPATLGRPRLRGKAGALVSVRTRIEPGHFDLLTEAVELGMYSSVSDGVRDCFENGFPNFKRRLATKRRSNR